MKRRDFKLIVFFILFIILFCFHSQLLDIYSIYVSKIELSKLSLAIGIALVVIVISGISYLLSELLTLVLYDAYKTLNKIIDNQIIIDRGIRENRSLLKDISSRLYTIERTTSRLKRPEGNLNTEIKSIFFLIDSIVNHLGIDKDEFRTIVEDRKPEHFDNLYLNVRECNFGKQNTRIQNAFKANDILYLKDIVLLSRRDFKSLRNMGAESVKEVDKFLKEKNLKFDMDKDLIERNL